MQVGTFNEKKILEDSQVLDEEEWKLQIKQSFNIEDAKTINES